jgi:hypothetical protein
MTKGYYGSSINSHPHGGTPEHILEHLKEQYGLSDFDPCPNNPSFDGLSIEWPKGNPVFVNPPYSRGELKKWVKKCFDEFNNGSKIIMLIPSYTDTIYFHEYIYPYARLEFIKGRLKFKGYDGQASFPSMLVYFGVE